MPKFNDQQERPALIEPQDAIFCVLDMECGLSKKKGSEGCASYKIEFEIEPSGKRVFEDLDDSKDWGWKIDTFLKSAGVAPAKGEDFEFQKDKAETEKVKWIDPIGLRGWCRVTKESYQKGKLPGAENTRTVNRIGTFYVDKPKLPRREMPAEEPMPF